MREETRKILDMLEKGALTAKQAEDLMEAMGFYDMTPLAIGGKRGAKRLIINVDSADGDKVRVKVPAAMIKAGLGLAETMKINDDNAMKDVDFNAVMEVATAMIESGDTGELITVDSASGDHVVIRLE